MKNVFKITVALMIVIMGIISVVPNYVCAATDNIKPVAQISGINAGISVKEGGSLTFTVICSDNTAISSVYLAKKHVTLNGFAADISISGDTTRTITLSNISGTGSGKSITIAAGVVTDTSGNKSDAITSSSFTITSATTSSTDTEKPQITFVSQSATSVKAGGSITYKVSYSDNQGLQRIGVINKNISLNGFTADIQVTMGTSAATIVLSNIQGTAGTKYVTIVEGALADFAGNLSSAKVLPSFTLTSSTSTVTDKIKPVVTVSAASPANVTMGSSVVYTLTFSDNTAVSKINFNSNFVELKGFTATKSVSINGNTATVTLSNINGTVGTKYIVIAAEAIADAAGNTSISIESPKFNLTSATPVVTDNIKPVVTVSAASPANVTVGGKVTYTLTFSDNVAVSKINFNSSYVELNGFTATKSVSINGNTATVTLTNVNGTTGTKSITINPRAIADAAGNTSISIESPKFNLTSATPVVTDNIKPVVTVSAANPSSVVSGESVVYTLTFSDNIAVTKINFNSNFVELKGFTATKSVSINGNTATVTLSNINGTVGAKYIVIAAEAIADAAGNTSISIESPKFNLIQKVTPIVSDTTAPIVKVSDATPSSIYAGEKVIYTVTFSDDKEVTKINFTKNFVVLHGFTADVSISGNGNTRTVTLTNVKGDIGTGKYITVKAEAIADAAGNTSAEATSGKFEIIEKSVPVEKDTTEPVVKISDATPSKIYAGEKVTYVVTFSDNKDVSKINFTKEYVVLHGFTATVSISGKGNTRTVTLTNVQGDIGTGKYITVKAGAIADAAGNISAEATSGKFEIAKKAEEKQEEKKQEEKKQEEKKQEENNNNNSSTVVTRTFGSCIDDLSLLGDINKEITYFSSWLRAEKYTATYVQENNVVAEDERMTYMVEYYNGSTAPSPEVTFELTIPYRVEVEEINGGGYIKTQNSEKTVIVWDMGKIPSKAYCRLYVRVKFTENTKLEQSKNISEVFYATLKTTAGGNNSYSYMRQLFVDRTEGKTGTFKSYLMAIDSTNQIRPDDEITRAEFAKLLADCGIVELDTDSTAYKTFKDWEKIPVYARAAVASLVGTDIIQAFPDGTFKPNNPILMEDALQMIAQAARYISDTKLTITKPTFLYTSSLLDSFGDLTEKKDYIMELMRQNVIVKYESNPDKYATRKEIVEIVNALTFRGPYVEKLPSNTMKFIDIRDDSKYFYDIIGASNSYTYTYDYRLWQEIVEIQ